MYSTRTMLRFLCWVVLALLLAAPSAIAQDDGVALKKKVDIDVVQKPLGLVIEYLQKITGQNIVMGFDRHGKPILTSRDLRVTIQLEEEPWEQALIKVCKAAGVLLKTYDQNVWYVYQPPLVTLDCLDQDLVTVLDSIAAQCRRNILYRAQSLGELRRAKVTLRVTSKPWHEVLQTLVQTAGIRVLVDEEEEIFIVGFPTEKVTDQQWKPWPLPDKTLRGVNDKTFDIDIHQKPLVAIADYVSQVTGKKVLVSTGEERKGYLDARLLRVSMKLDDVYWDTGIELLAEGAGASTRRIDADTILIYKNPDLVFSVDRAGLASTLLAVSRMGGFDLSVKSAVASGISVRAGLRNVTWKKVMRALVFSSGLIAREDKAGHFTVVGMQQPGKEPVGTAKPCYEAKPESGARKIKLWTEELKALQRELIVNPKIGTYYRWERLLRDVGRYRFTGKDEFGRLKILDRLESLDVMIRNAHGEAISRELHRIDENMDLALDESPRECATAFMAGVFMIAESFKFRTAGKGSREAILSKVLKCFEAMLLTEKGSKTVCRMVVDTAACFKRRGVHELGPAKKFVAKLRESQKRAETVLRFYSLGLHVEAVLFTPKRKMVILGGSIYKEGDPVGIEGASGGKVQKLKILEIHRNGGVVFEFGGTRITLTMGKGKK